MKKLFTLIALAVVPLSLSAQTKTPVARKPASSAVSSSSKPQQTQATRPAASKTSPATKSTTPVSKAASVAQVGNTKPASSATAQASSAPQSQATASVAKAAPAETSKPVRTATVSPATAKESRFKVGFRAGGNYSTIGGFNTEDLGGQVTLSRVMGFHGGLVMNFGGPSFSVQPEVLYSQYGFKMAAGPSYIQFKYNVVEIPVLLKASFGKPGMRAFVNAGPVAGFVMSGNMSYSVDGETGSQKMDMSNEGRGLYGAAGGAGVSLQAGPGHVQLEGRYTYLLGSTTSAGTKMKPQNAMISVSYLLPIGGK